MNRVLIDLEKRFPVCETLKPMKSLEVIQFWNSEPVLFQSPNDLNNFKYTSEFKNLLHLIEQSRNHESCYSLIANFYYRFVSFLETQNFDQGLLFILYRIRELCLSRASRNCLLEYLKFLNNYCQEKSFSFCLESKPMIHSYYSELIQSSPSKSISEPVTKTHNIIQERKVSTKVSKPQYLMSSINDPKTPSLIMIEHDRTSHRKANEISSFVSYLHFQNNGLVGKDCKNFEDLYKINQKRVDEIIGNNLAKRVVNSIKRSMIPIALIKEIEAIIS